MSVILFTLAMNMLVKSAEPEWRDQGDWQQPIRLPWII